MMSNGIDTRLAGLIDSAMDAIISVDEAQRVVVFNRAAEQMFGWSASELIGQPLQRLLPSRFHVSHAEHIRRFSSTNQTMRRMNASQIVYGLRKNGEEFPMEASISQARLPEGKLFTAIVRDVTERVRIRAELRAFAAEASSVREQERSRIARELHDELAQVLSVLKLHASRLRQSIAMIPEGVQDRLDVIEGLLDDAVASTRRIAASLRPLILDDLGLVPAIECLVQAINKREGVVCSLEAEAELDLQEPFATAVFRIVQESLNNVAKHANATHAEVCIRRSEDSVIVAVRDNGVGFDVSSERKQQSLGLVGLRERVYLLRGELQIDSDMGKGTRVQVVFPLPDAGSRP